MTPLEQIRAWFDELAESRPEQLGNGPQNQAWMYQTQSAIEQTFPASHALVARMRDAIEGRVISRPEPFRKKEAQWTAACAAFEAARQIVNGDRLRNFADIIRVEDEAGLIRQAEWLLDEGAIAAAAVLSGGALEMHLAALCVTHEIEWRRDPPNRPDEQGSITKYNGAIGKARKDRGTAPYSAADGDFVSAWGKLRNEAAHAPTQFHQEQSPEAVRAMIDGIRSFITRAP